MVGCSDSKCPDWLPGAFYSAKDAQTSSEHKSNNTQKQESSSNYHRSKIPAKTAAQKMLTVGATYKRFSARDRLDLVFC